MIRIMNTLLVIALFFTVSCNQSTSKEKTSLNRIELKQENQSKIDSVIVKYWKNTEANEYVFQYLDDVLQIKSEYFDFEKTINNKQINQIFLKYVNQFYIDKKDKIILSKTKRDHIESTDYSKIQVVGYQGYKEVFNKRTQIGNEEYDIEFHPKFLEFYEFLDTLIKQK